LDASHLWGNDVLETKQMLKDELELNKIQILCIGPAGENKVFSSSIEHTMGAGAHRAGVGAVMGHKKLEAIVVHGTNDIHVAKPTELKKTCDHILSKTGPIKQYWNNWPE
jgi:aldehyde:ferredoxin oxidoreductase